MGRAARAGIVLLSLLAAGCAPGSADVKGAIERAWAEHPEEMSVAARLEQAGDATGALAATSLAARTGRSVIDAYTHGYGGALAGKVVAIGSDLVRSTGLPHGRAADDRLQRALATGWTVTDLKIVDSRKSGDAWIYDVRYSLYADTARGHMRILQDNAELLRMIKVGRTWTIDISAIPGQG